MRIPGKISADTNSFARFILPVVCISLCVAADAALTGESKREPGWHGSPILRRVSFRNDVEPILTRAACNSGACHGSQFGKGGFKLSLAAYDPDQDFEAIAKLSGGRRLTLTEPERSLFLTKPALRIAHLGGLRLRPDSEDYRTILAWIRQGAQRPDPKDPSVVALQVIPKKTVLAPGDSTQVHIVARYSDGAAREVTAHTRINSLNDSVATAAPDGVVRAAASGETAIMLRYDGLASISRIVVPYGRRRRSPEIQANAIRARTPIDRIIANKWRELGLTPSSRCTDYEFIRRASLDITGTLPESDEVRLFAEAPDPFKRAKLVDRLLDRPEYADYWTVKWCDLLRSSRTTLGAKSSAAFTEWVRSAVARNEPYDRFVRELLTARGSSSAVAPANYYRVATTPQDLTETTAQLFLGVRLQCARCHHHPFEKWSQTDYYRFAAFFARTTTKSAPGGDQMVLLRGDGEVTHPKTGARMEPAPLAMAGSTAFESAPGDRRELLANWLTSPGNLPFAEMAVNRYWAYFLGRGIVDPVDDVRVTNPPSNPELLDWLARDFIRSGFDLKRLIRSICTSEVYQLSSRTTTANRPDRVFYSHFLPRRQPAEVLLDSIGIATGVREKFTGLPDGMRAIQLPDASVQSMFLDTFGRPPRSSACECERVMEPSLPQALQLLNGDTLNRKVCSAHGHAAALAAKNESAQGLVNELYLSVLSRPPSADELRTALSAVNGPPRRQAIEDLMWALLNMDEFAMIR